MCKLCALHNTSAKAAVDSVRLVFTFRYESEAICSDDFHEHIVDQMSFDHDDGNFELIIDTRNPESQFQISVSPSDDQKWLINEVARQVQQAIDTWQSRSTKLVCA
jgi:hypothetical protein